jgi:ABC-type ATPase with predicted acetyltransferase domain
MSTDTDRKQVDLGTTVYDADGNPLGTVRGFDEHGFYITAADDVVVLSEDTVGSEHAKALMWRCWECGEMGRIEDIPDECPSCGASREEIYYWQED